MSRIWMVDVTIAVPVYAEDEGKAREVACRYAPEEHRNDVFNRRAKTVVTEIRETDDEDLRICLPWNGPDDLTIGELLRGSRSPEGTETP